MQQTLLKIPERGAVEISKATWLTLAADPNFWSLANRGIVSVEHSSATAIRLVGGCYVGRAIIGGRIILELEEKIPNSLKALITHASRTSFRVHPLGSPSSSIGPLISILAQQFTESVSRYLSSGREFKYRQQQLTGPLIGGKLRITGTIRLRARGLRHLAEFEKHVVAFDTSVNKVLLTTLRELERIHRIMPLDAQTLARSRALALLFSDCRTTDVMFGLRTGFVKLAANQLASSSVPLIRDLMALAGVLLSHESFEPGPVGAEYLPRAWFLNLENLFEVAVRNVFTDLMSGRGYVYNGRVTSNPIFLPGTNQYKAHPDFIVGIAGKGCAVGDAKFKIPQPLVAPSDLYQLLVHAAAYDAPEAFLVYPDQSYSVIELGPAKTGSRVNLFRVDLRNLPHDLARVLTTVLPGSRDTEIALGRTMSKGSVTETHAILPS